MASKQHLYRLTGTFSEADLNDLMNGKMVYLRVGCVVCGNRFTMVKDTGKDFPWLPSISKDNCEGVDHVGD